MRVTYDLFGLAVLAFVGWAAVDAFGWLHGVGILGAVYLLMPWRPKH